MTFSREEGEGSQQRSRQLKLVKSVIISRANNKFKQHLHSAIGQQVHAPGPLLSLQSTIRQDYLYILWSFMRVN